VFEYEVGGEGGSFTILVADRVDIGGCEIGVSGSDGCLFLAAPRLTLSGFGLSQLKL